MTLIRTYDDRCDIRSDSDALDALAAEVDREGVGGADVAMLADAIVAARKDCYGTGICTARPAVAVLTTQTAERRLPSTQDRGHSWPAWRLWSLGPLGRGRRAVSPARAEESGHDQPASSPEVFAGYWQPDGIWRDVDGGPGGVELTHAIERHLSNRVGTSKVVSVTVHFLSFSGESPDSKTWTRGTLRRAVKLPRCPDRSQGRGRLS